ncbi:MAG: single-stranded DNA-binding protein [bacterium]|nr:single-stranded DNA-binding protein [bacterium]
MYNNTSARVEGYVTQDPRLVKTKTGKSVCNFSLAVRHYSNADVDPKVSFIDIETWEKVAEICSNSITRGKRIMVFGNLRQDRWQGKDGKPQSKIKVIGNEIRFLESQTQVKRETETETEEPQSLPQVA